MRAAQLHCGDVRDGFSSGRLRVFGLPIVILVLVFIGLEITTFVTIHLGFIPAFNRYRVTGGLSRGNEPSNVFLDRSR